MYISLAADNRITSVALNSVVQTLEYQSFKSVGLQMSQQLSKPSGLITLSLKVSSVAWKES